MTEPLQIAIDGPVAAGKGDIAERLAKKLRLTYLYTGAMYRALGLACLRAGVSPVDSAKVTELLRSTKIELVSANERKDRSYQVLLDREDVTDEIYLPEVAQAASDVSTIAEIRQFMVARQRALASGKSVVAEGRDIGLRVLPQAQLKIFLTASVEERAHRRQAQLQKKGIKKTYDDVLEGTKERDLRDSTRTTDPLQKLPEAWELDTTHLTQEEVVEKIMQELRRRRLV